jgi:hypothetical protein
MHNEYGFDSVDTDLQVPASKFASAGVVVPDAAR